MEQRNKHKYPVAEPAERVEEPSQMATGFVMDFELSELRGLKEDVTRWFDDDGGALDADGVRVLADAARALADRAKAIERRLRN